MNHRQVRHRAAQGKGQAQGKASGGGGYAAIIKRTSKGQTPAHRKNATRSAKS